MKRWRWCNLVFLAILLTVSASGPVQARGPAPNDVRGVEPDAPSTADVPADWWAAVQEEIRRSEYAITQQEPSEAGAPADYQAPNRAHALRTSFTESGIHLAPRVPSADTDWQLTLAFSGYGYESSELQTTTPAVLDVAVDATRIEYHRGPLLEWYVNDERGLEQGFTLPLPKGTQGDTVVLELAHSGDLLPRLIDGGAVIEFVAAGEPVLRSSDLRAADATGRTLPVRFALSAPREAGAVTLVVSAADAAYPLTVAHTLTGVPTSSWRRESDQNDAQFGTAVASIGDFNGDGYDDVAVGAPYYDDGLTDRGEVFLYYGSVNGLPSTGYSLMLAGNAANDRFGETVAAAGDVNGDSYDDMIIGAPGGGYAKVHYGSASGPAGSPWTATAMAVSDYFGVSVGTAGDVNGDGYDDIIVGAMNADPLVTDAGAVYVWYGASAGLGASGTPANADWSGTSGQDGAHFGRSVGTAGDLNRDGYDDIVVGANSYNNGETDEGAVFVWYGSLTGLGTAGLPSNADWSAQSNQAEAYLGTSAGTAGDVNGDGYADLITGAYRYDDTQDNGGRAYVFYGASAGLSCSGGCPVNANTAADWIADGSLEDAGLGAAAAAAGDVNGDGYDDVLLGALYDNSGENDAGRADLYHGSPVGLEDGAVWSDGGGQAGEGYGWSVAGAGDVNGDGCDDFLVGAPFYDHGQTAEGRAYLYYGSPFALDTKAAWSAVSGQKGAHLGSSVSTAGDVNGDGFSDVAVGVPTYDNPTNGGKVLVYYGSAAGLPTTASWTATNNQAQARFGAAVATAGDFNGDGYADLAIGAPSYDYSGRSDAGAAFVYFGSASGLGSPGTPSNADWAVYGTQAEAEFGYDLGTAGDVNRDYYDELIVGAPFYNAESGRVYVYHGSATPDTTADWQVDSPRSAAAFGYSVDTAGDTNRDGYADVVIGAPFDVGAGGTAGGYVYVYFGSAGGLGATPWTSYNTQSGAQHGSAVAAAGDANGDGYSDIIMGAPYLDSDGADRGRVYVCFGASGTTLSCKWAFDGGEVGAHLGAAVSTAGDVNGDGYADMIAGAPHAGGSLDGGWTYVYYGGDYGDGYYPTIGSGWAIRGRANSRTGSAFGNAGDVNGDGYADVIVGAPLYSDTQMQEGWAAVYYGAPAGPSPTPQWAVNETQADTYFGFAVGTAGDVDSDGYADVIVGAPYYDNGQTNEGRVFVYYGSYTGLPTTADWTAESDQAGGSTSTQFGADVGTAGDVNGDGYEDVIVGAWRYDHGQTDEGSAFVWYGSADGLGSSGTPSNADWSVEGNQGEAFFGYSVGTAGDVNADGYADLVIGAHGYNGGAGSDTGRVYVYYGSATGPSTVVTLDGDKASAFLGNAVGPAGDVNGDGYSDIIVGASSYSNPDLYEGRVYVYHGSADGLDTDPAATLEGGWANAYFGSSVGTAGDVNGDGYADVIIGAPILTIDQTYEGRAYIYYGSSTGLDGGGAPWWVEGNQAGAYLGNAVGTAGDVNGDGYADVIVGAYRYDAGEVDEGRAYLYLGSPTGPAYVPDWMAESDQVNGAFGLAVGTAGDVNGDGYADVIVGSGGYFSAGDAAKQRALVFYGNGSGGRPLVPRQTQTDLDPLAPLGMTDTCSAVRLSLWKRMPIGRDRVRLQWQLAPLGVAFGTTGSGAFSGTSSWYDTGGMLILPFLQDVDGLQGGTPYRWRVRLQYDPGNRLGQAAGPWVHVPWNGWSEEAFRTPYCSLYLPLVQRNKS